ncbi:MAG TPA: signal peptidase I [Chthonomonadales bacterium]|nr:signal peptidase I [Chthonomonadales bacterium]
MHPAEGGATEVLANLSIGHIVMAAFLLTAVRLVLVPSRGVIARSIAELVESLTIAGVLVFLIIRPFFVQAFFIPSESMEPTLQGHTAGFNPLTNTTYPDTVHDHIFVNKLIYRFREPQRGDIIVFRAEKKADKEHFDPHEKVENVLIKRLIAIPGDTIEIKGGKVYLNGKPLNEPYINRAGQPDAMRDTPHADYAVNGPLKLGPGELFVMGDNRNNSNDSRFWGTLPRDRVIGKAMFIFWPLSRIGFIR